MVIQLDDLIVGFDRADRQRIPFAGVDGAFTDGDQIGGTCAGVEREVVGAACLRPDLAIDDDVCSGLSCRTLNRHQDTGGNRRSPLVVFFSACHVSTPTRELASSLARRDRSCGLIAPGQVLAQQIFDWEFHFPRQEAHAAFAIRRRTPCEGDAGGGCGKTLLVIFRTAECPYPQAFMHSRC